MVTNMDIMVTLGELWDTKLTVLWSLLNPSVAGKSYFKYLTTLLVQTNLGSTLIY